MYHRLLLLILPILLLPIAAFAQTPVTRDTEDAYPPGRYRLKSNDYTVFTCPSHSCTSEVRISQVGSVIQVIREVLPQNQYSTFRWVEIVSGNLSGYMLAEFLERVSPTPATAVPVQAETEIQEEDVVSIRLTRGRQASHELIYSTFLRTVPNTASYSSRDNLASGSLIFTEEGEYLVLFRSFIIANIDDYPYLPNSLEVDRPRGSCRSIAVAEGNNAIVFLNCPGTVDFTYDTDGDYVSIFIFRILE